MVVIEHRENTEREASEKVEDSIKDNSCSIMLVLGLICVEFWEFDDWAREHSLQICCAHYENNLIGKMVLGGIFFILLSSQYLCL